MRRPRRVTLLRSGNRLVIDPTTPKLRDLLLPGLRYVEKKYLHGMARRQRKLAGLPVFDEIEWDCYSLDRKGRIATSFGFLERIQAALTAAGYESELEWATAEEEAARAKLDETVYKPRWDRLTEFMGEEFKFRYKQKKLLEIIAAEDNGRIDCHTGWGKGTGIALAGVLFPKAKIDVTTKRIAVLDRLYQELVTTLPSVGRRGGGFRESGKRVMCISADSLHHARPDADIVFVDEGHEACADDFAASLGIYERAKIFMFSASWDMRLDNKDLRAEAIGGPIRLRVSYDVGVKKGIVVPIEVIWSDVVMDENPCSGIDRPDLRKLHGLWGNEYRNKVIARDARLYGKDVQTLITVETLEHAMNLKQLLPDFTVMYAGQGMTPQETEWFKTQYPDTFRPMTPERRRKLTKRFEKGSLKKVIATTVWNVGVDFRHLEVVIRGDGGGSPINDNQIPGRNSRKKRDADVASGAKKKLVGIVHDYRDQFDPGFARRAKNRQTSYERNKWAQHFPKAEAKSLLRRLMDMGSLV